MQIIATANFRNSKRDFPKMGRIPPFDLLFCAGFGRLRGFGQHHRGDLLLTDQIVECRNVSGQHLLPLAKLLIDLPATLAPGKEFVLEIAYSGEPVVEASAYIPFVSHVGMIRPDNESLYAASEPNGSRY